MTVRARVRGIYATALTRRLLDEGHEVVQASGPIRERFDADFGSGDHDVSATTTDDRQGVGLTGHPDDVATVGDLCADVGVDALSWAADAPEGAVFDGCVTETLGSGAVVDLGETTGFLPYDAADGYVDEGDDRRVQVRTPHPPWDERRPELGTDVVASAGLATLVRGGAGVRVDTRDDAAGRELVGMTEFLDADVPEGWGLRWSHAATDADMPTLSASLEAAAARAATLETALDADVAATRTVASPLATTWVWFGRESRFALDEARREVATTMPGHHRIKATHESASAGVDFAEALCDPVGEFPFDVVTAAFGPVEGDEVAIAHGKPDGRLVVLGHGEVVERDDDGTLAVRREMTGGGRYDALGTPREAGDTALTKFREGRWWYPTVYRGEDGERKGTYVNVCTPVECFPEAVRYVDLHVDVVKHPGGRVERVDDDELDAAVDAGEVSEALADRARSVATSLENAL
jgi:protein associated with RNAse G/E